MTRRSVRLIGVGLVAVVVLAVVLATAGGGDGAGTGDGAAGGDEAGVTVGPDPHDPTDPAAADTGGIDVPSRPGTFPVAVPSLGFGVAIPDGWQATLLNEDALGRLARASGASPAFVSSAQSLARTGAVFYAADVDDRGRVSELKLDVQSGADTGADALRALADEVAAADGLQDTEVVELDGGRVRVDYRVVLPSAEDGEEIEAVGSQVFVPDGDRLWSLIITSEEQQVQDELVDLFAGTFVAD